MKKEKVPKSKDKKKQKTVWEDTRNEEDEATSTDQKMQETRSEEEEKEKVKLWQKTCLDVMQKEEVLKTLQLLLKSVNRDKKKALLSDDKEEIQLQFAVKKIPSVKNKIIKLRLPHSVWRPEQEVCLFVKDLNKSSREHEVTERHFKDLLSSKGISCITQVIPLKCLKLEYKPFEAKRNLANMFDLFVSDERIMRLLPSLLGKNFYGKRKHPIQVNLKAANLKEEIEKVVYDSRCIISGMGASSAATVGYSDMSVEKLADNVMKAVESICAALPGGPANIQSVYVRTGKSLALPLFATFSSKQEVKLPKKPKKPEPVVGELSTLMNGHVLITNMGDIKVGKMDEDGKFMNMRQKVAPPRTTKRKIDEESDDEMHFEEVKSKKIKKNFEHKENKTPGDIKGNDSVSPEFIPEVGENVETEATSVTEGSVSSKPEKRKNVSTKTKLRKGKNASPKTKPEKKKKLSTNEGGKLMMKKTKSMKNKKSKSVTT
ncbi:ribosomal L1 domain-containing protein 1-like [Ylistrum balloti]|uniref:ribosomal L1 domain-containing protein 1-like n=1 Tax=Ylistrum balloti TaxID=509963 RepID=UPI002905B01C|nr:ribosomal L1 domain-containing protein 1-like [Ylistrum balloti]